MPWIILKLDTEPDQLPALENFLTNAGATAITFEDNADQPLFEPPLGTMPVWENTRLSAMFNAEEDLDNIVALLQSQLKQDMPQYRIEALEDKDWEREWMDNFHPIAFGERLWVCPSWCKPPKKDAVNLLLDPGLAFGTGTHPTTSLCLKWLDTQPLSNKIVVDYGCGSGILAVAAALLGAKKVWAVDNDPQALIATKANAERNHVSTRIQITSPDQFEEAFILKAKRADVVLANILAGPLIHLAVTLKKLLNLGGNLVLSGILKEQAEQLKSHYRQWFTIDTTVSEEDWVRITGIRSSNETRIND